MKRIVNKIISVLIKHSDYKNHSPEEKQTPEEIIYLRCYEGDSMLLKEGEIYKVKKPYTLESVNTLFYEVCSPTRDLPGFYDEKRFTQDVTPFEKKKFELAVFTNSFSRTSS